MKRIPYGRQEIGEEDVAAVLAALRAPFLTQGPRVEEFEDLLAREVGARYAVVFNSGTAALHAAYAAAGVGPGRPIVTSPITFAATANAARYLGADIVFADVEPMTGLLDVGAVQAATEHVPQDPYVLVPVHFGGQVADVVRLQALAAPTGGIVIEDAAHALGAMYTTSTGTTHRVGACAHSAMCCFSFHPVKHVTTGEGGAVTTNDEEYARALRRFRSHGITRDQAELLGDEHGPWYYEQQVLGYNYRLTDLQCALGMSQLRRLDSFLARRRAIAARYDQAFVDSRCVEPLHVPATSHGAYHLYVVLVPASARRALVLALHAQGIGAQVHYIPVYRHPYYRRTGFEDFALPRAEAYYSRAISLPMFPGLTGAEQDFVIDALNNEVRHYAG